MFVPPVSGWLEKGVLRGQGACVCVAWSSRANMIQISPSCVCVTWGGGIYAGRVLGSVWLDAPLLTCSMFVPPVSVWLEEGIYTQAGCLCLCDLRHPCWHDPTLSLLCLCDLRRGVLRRRGACVCVAWGTLADLLYVCPSCVCVTWEVGGSTQAGCLCLCVLKHPC